MKIPTIRGLIDRRILVNFRIAPALLTNILPKPFRPQIVNGFGVAGICLIRLAQVRLKWMPAWMGVSSENAAHRIAVEWDTASGVRTGVFVPRRDTSSRLNSMAGGRIFPGVQNRAHFDVDETEDDYRIGMQSIDKTASVSVECQRSAAMPDDSIFRTIDDASRFFKAGSLGYSPQRTNRVYDGMELKTFTWSLEPLSVSQVESSFFEDRCRFPVGSVTFDNALLMRGIEHEWHSGSPICCKD